MVVAVNLPNMNRSFTDENGNITREWWYYLQQLRERTGGSTDIVAGGVNTGDIKGFGGTASPAGWLLCDGSAVSRDDFSDLFSVIGTKFGAGNGTTTFNVPDGEGRMLVGSGGNFAIGGEGGLEEVALSEANNGLHIHGIDDPGHQHGA